MMATKLTELRQKNGLSQNQLAEELDVCRQAISKWELGKAVPTTDNLIALSRLYGVTVDELLSGSEPPEQAPKPEAAPKPVPEITNRTEETKTKKAFPPIAILWIVIGCVCAGILVWGELYKSQFTARSHVVLIVLFTAAASLFYEVLRLIKFLILLIKRS